MGYTSKPHSDLMNGTEWTPGLGTHDKAGKLHPGKFVTMDLAPEQIDHMVKRFEQVGEKPLHDRASGRAIVGEALAKTPQAGCMWWLVHAETAPNVNLNSALGTGRSKTPENQIRKILHQAGAKVRVVGIPVEHVNDFKAMTDEMLLGPSPKATAQDR
ncbi:MAG: hypothetical protein GY811_21945 [Myxococcales bacterium]|nr:hypothetical protein [Myxococcales bacterium]